MKDQPESCRGIFSWIAIFFNLKLLIEIGNTEKEDLLRPEHKRKQKPPNIKSMLFLNTSLDVLEFNILENSISLVFQKKKAVICQQRLL